MHKAGKIPGLVRVAVVFRSAGQARLYVGFRTNQNDQVNVIEPLRSSP